MKGIVCIGIDPSISGTALYKLKDFVPIESWSISTKKKKFKDKNETTKKKATKSTIEEIADRMQREYEIYVKIKEILLREKPSYIGLEGYSYMGSNLAIQAEVAGVILLAISFYKRVCKDEKIKVVVFTPQSLKKYITGKGGGKKEIIIKEIYKRYNIDTDNNNIADAFVLANMASDFALIDGERKIRKDMKSYQLEIFKNIFSTKKLVADILKNKKGNK